MVEVSRLNSDPQNLVELFRTSDRPVVQTTHNTHKGQTSMPTARFEPAVPARERVRTQALHRAATGIGCLKISLFEYLARCTQDVGRYFLQDFT